MRMRGINQAFKEIKEKDPASAVSLYSLRMLVKTKPDLFIRSGRRILCNLDLLEAYYSNPASSESPARAGGIRRIEVL